MAVHHFDLWYYLTGKKVRSVNVQTQADAWDDNTVVVSARLEDDTLVGATFAQRSTQRSTQRNRLELYGQENSLHLALYQFDGCKVVSNSEIPGSLSDRFKAVKQFAQALPKAIPVVREGGEWQQTYVAQWRHFADAVMADVQPGCGIDDGRRAVAVCLAAAESASTGSTVEIDDA